MHVKDFSSENYCEHCLYDITRRGLMLTMDVKLLAYFPLDPKLLLHSRRRYNCRQYFVDHVRLLCTSSANSVMTALCLLLLHFIVSSRKRGVLGQFTIHMVQLYTDQPHVWLEHEHHPTSNHTCG